MEQKIQDEGEMQSALMPQELNPEFISDKDSPLRAIFPLRQRRDVYDSSPAYETTTSFKTYSRVVTCVVLAVSALIEIIVYIIETWLV
ncbi:unnamed protein product [Pieris macdunnoughi]|uniref:Uncharacterized protein n=1 Tax=Pieris macdunnoughi TaxID=345717 RepID=A0A821XLF1_9NEOP|nr:unnamed protein product [Pieris macdunnoughi]